MLVVDVGVDPGVNGGELSGEGLDATSGGVTTGGCEAAVGAVTVTSVVDGATGDVGEMLDGILTGTDSDAS